MYALATMLYELLAGVLPFPEEGRDTAALLFQHAYEAPVPLGDAAPGVPGPVAAVVMRALATDPAQRFATAESFGVALAGACTQAWGPGWLPDDVPIMDAGPIMSAAGHPAGGGAAPAAGPVTARAESGEHEKTLAAAPAAGGGDAAVSPETVGTAAGDAPASPETVRSAAGDAPASPETVRSAARSIAPGLRRRRHHPMAVGGIHLAGLEDTLQPVGSTLVAGLHYPALGGRVRSMVRHRRRLPGLPGVGPLARGVRLPGLRAPGWLADGRRPIPLRRVRRGGCRRRQGRSSTRRARR